MFFLCVGYYQQPTTSNVQRLLSREAFTGGGMFFGSYERRAKIPAMELRTALLALQGRVHDLGRRSKDGFSLFLLLPDPRPHTPDPSSSRPPSQSRVLADLYQERGREASERRTDLLLSKDGFRSYRFQEHTPRRQEHAATPLERGFRSKAD